MASESVRRALRFVFGVHLHQPVGNFDSVFEEHVEQVYLPFLRRVAERELFPIALHVSGPLIEWMEAHDARYLDLVGQLAASGKVELLLAGMYEPILASLPRADRIEQIAWMRDTLAWRFGVTARGLWLTERVWEPGLAEDLADAGVEFALVDDRHFEVAGFPPERLHAPFVTESGGKRVTLFPIDRRLRYLVPFHDVRETADYLRSLREAGHQLAVLADDGEKFGGWPGTRVRVYDEGWLDEFIDEMHALDASGEVVLSTFADALSTVQSGGLAYLPAASYREMETWTLPADMALRLEELEEELGAERMEGRDGALVRGGHWRNFQVKYPESNRMHKKMQALSALARTRGDETEARRAIGRGQCNDAYWHGVFGGLYLPHLRQGIWRELARAERLLRAGEPLAYDVLDLDADGANEIWVHSAALSVQVSSARGGAIEELTLLGRGVNVADTLTRRREAYHRLREERDAKTEEAEESTHAPSIHEIEEALRLDELPPVDLDTRALFVDRVVPGTVTFEEYERAEYQPIARFARAPLAFEVEQRDGTVAITLTGELARWRKRITVAESSIRVEYEWEAGAFPADALVAVELSLATPVPLRAGGALHEWRFPIETVSKSEHGFEHTVQGENVTCLWRASAGAAWVELEIA